MYILGVYCPFLPFYAHRENWFAVATEFVDNIMITFIVWGCKNYVVKNELRWYSKIVVGPSTITYISTYWTKF